MTLFTISILSAIMLIGNLPLAMAATGDLIYTKQVKMTNPLTNDFTFITCDSGDYAVSGGYSADGKITQLRPSTDGTFEFSPTDVIIQWKNLQGPFNGFVTCIDMDHPNLLLQCPDGHVPISENTQWQCTPLPKTERYFVTENQHFLHEFGTLYHYKAVCDAGDRIISGGINSSHSTFATAEHKILDSLPQIYNGEEWWQVTVSIADPANADKITVKALCEKDTT